MDKSKSELYTATLDKEGKIVWVKKKNSMGAFDYFNYAFFILFGVICLFPVVYEVLLSFASRADYLHFKIIVFPAHFNLEAYKSIFFQGQVGRSFLISVGLTVGGTLYSMILTSLGAYIFTRQTGTGHENSLYVRHFHDVFRRRPDSLLFRLQGHFRHR